MNDTWPADNVDAKDPLDRHNYERCLAESAYAEQHREWFRYAARERARREAETQREAHQTTVNEFRIAALDARIAEDRKKAEEATGRRGARINDATARLRGNARRF